jgi:hypothetical protein
LECNVFSETIKTEPDMDDELMYNSLDGKDDLVNNEVYPDDWEEPKIAMEDAHDGEMDDRMMTSLK